MCTGYSHTERPDGTCIMDTLITCRDNHAYRAECDKMGTDVGTCKCFVDGVLTKTVQSICAEAPFACGWPKSVGDTSNERQCPRLVEQVKFDENGSRVPGCTVRPASACRDGHVYSAECERWPDEVGQCTCMIDGTPTGKTVDATCLGAHAACGFPPAE